MQSPSLFPEDPQPISLFTYALDDVVTWKDGHCIEWFVSRPIQDLLMSEVPCQMLPPYLIVCQPLCLPLSDVWVQHLPPLHISSSSLSPASFSNPESGSSSSSSGGQLAYRDGHSLAICGLRRPLQLVSWISQPWFPWSAPPSDITVFQMSAKTAKRWGYVGNSEKNHMRDHVIQIICLAGCLHVVVRCGWTCEPGFCQLSER